MIYIKEIHDYITVILPIIIFIIVKNKVIFSKLYILTMFIVHIIKYLCKCKRPDYDLYKETDSFPSGHTASIYFVTIYYIYLYKLTIFSYILLLLSVLIVYLRIYYNRHSIYDILGSIIICHIILYLYKHNLIIN